MDANKGNLMEQDYIDGTVDAPFDTAESQDEAAASHEYSLNVLYLVGCEYNISDSHMRLLCGLACVRFAELQKHSGATA
jgi:hypothetical protein